MKSSFVCTPCLITFCSENPVKFCNFYSWHHALSCLIFFSNQQRLVQCIYSQNTFTYERWTLQSWLKGHWTPFYYTSMWFFQRVLLFLVLIMLCRQISASLLCILFQVHHHRRYALFAMWVPALFHPGTLQVPICTHEPIFKVVHW